jgi:ribosomal protein S20
MPISLSAKKSLRKSLKNHKENSSFKLKLKAIVKKFTAKPTKEGLSGVYSVLDKAKKNQIYHPNKVARLKAKFAKSVKTGEVKSAVLKTKKKAAKRTVKKTSKKTTKKMS